MAFWLTVHKASSFDDDEYPKPILVRGHLAPTKSRCRACRPQVISTWLTEYTSCVVHLRCCILSIVWEVDLEFVKSWLDDLDQGSYEQVVAALELLEERGPQLGRPLVDTVKASRHKNMKELRPGSRGRSELRILFAFDAQRNAILLVAGDKSSSWAKWYAINIPIADDRFEEHTRKLNGEH